MSIQANVSSVVPARTDVLAAINAASVKTGSDFSYLLATAMRESGLDSQAQSKGSSATGLFQFIDQTWLGAVKRYGERHGLADYANAIGVSGDGHYTVASQETRSAILALRKNPELSALMAGESAKAIKQNLECALGREACEGELYAAHFLGEGNAKRLIALNGERPDCAAASEFPSAARANRSIFYKPDGTPKTVREVYAWAIELPDTSKAIAAAKPAPVAASVTIPYAPRTGAIASQKPSDEIEAPRQKLAQVENNYSGSGASRGYSNRGAEKPSAAVLPQQPLLLSPGVLEILASLAPLGFAFGRR